MKQVLGFLALLVFGSAFAAEEIMLIKGSQGGRKINMRQAYTAQASSKAFAAAGIDPDNLPPGIGFKGQGVEEASAAAKLDDLGLDPNSTAIDLALERMKSDATPGFFFEENLSPLVCTILSVCLAAADTQCALDGIRQAGLADIMSERCLFTCTDGGGSLTPMRGGITCE